MGTVCKGGLGLGNYETQLWSRASSKASTDLLVQEVRKKEEECRRVKAVSMVKQGMWASWEAAIERKLTWNNLWPMDLGKLKLLL